MFKRAAPVGEETETKRIKFEGEVEEKICIVRKQVGNAEARSDECCVMLENMVAGSLGPAMDERDELQSEAVEMIGKVIVAVEEEAEKAIKLAEEIIEDPEAAKAKLEQEAKKAADEKKDAENQKVAKLKAAEEAKKNLGKAEDTLKKANKALDKLLKQKADLTEKRDGVASAFEEHYKPIRDGDWGPESEAQRHINALVPLFRSFNYEPSLIEAFKEAGKIKPEPRRPFDHHTIKRAAFEEETSRLDKEIAALAEPIAKTQKAQHAAEAAKAAKSQKYKDALADLGNIMGAIRKWLAGLFRSHRELESFPKTAPERKLKLEGAKAVLEELTGPAGAVTAYVWLRDRLSQGGPEAFIQPSN